MISFHNIFSIAKYERKTLFRSWFFRIFSILSLLVLLGLNFGMIIEGGGGDGWIIQAVPAAIPYFNLLILNVAQAVIAVFLASDFLKRDKKLDTTEVIYMRAMTNGEYVMGKTLGNIQVFMMLNVAVMLMALIFNLLVKGTPVDWGAYGIYLLLISIPTLVFILGLSFLLMSVIRNQAITFVLVLGYIGITLFLLQSRYYYIFDYMTFNIPMLRSDIVGFGNLTTILAHRGIYLGLGIGFISLSVFLLKRLPQSRVSTYFSLIFAIIFIAGAGYLGFKHIYHFKVSEKLRAEIVALNNKYVKENIPSIVADKIDLEHKGETISVKSLLTIKNENRKALKKLIFNLNAGLKISEVKVNGKPLPFLREKHLVIISDNINLQSGDSAKVELSYAGSIDENYCYLDIDEETRLEKYGEFVINIDKRYAFITPGYVLLTDEAGWYPNTGVTYSSENVSWSHPQFVNYSLTVKTTPGLQAVSQGKINAIADGRFTFENRQPLTRISLAIGNYEQMGFDVGEKHYSAWLLKGHNYFSNAFPELKDTIPGIISEKLSAFERTYNLEYVFNRLALVEVPAQLKTYQRSWTSLQEYVQPEQIFVQEKGCMLNAADFEGSIKRMKRWGGRGPGRRGGNSSDEELQTSALNNFLRTFTEEEETDWKRNKGSFNMETSANPYFIFPMLYNFQNNIQSTQWPITNRVFEAYLKNQETDMRSVFMRDMNGLSNDEKANILLQDHSFNEILSDEAQKDIIGNVIKLKGDVLFSNIQYKVGSDKFESFLKQMLNEYRFKNISFETFNGKLIREFGINLIPMMDEWFKAKSLPGYLISPIKAVKVKSGDMMRTMVSLKITNFTETQGLVKFSFRLGGGFGGPGRPSGQGNEETIDKLVELGPHITKQLSYLLDADPRMVLVNTMTSKNIPQTITERFRNIDEDKKAAPFEGEKLNATPVQTVLSNEIIVDNEDPEFEVTNNQQENLLQKWLIKKDEEELKYSGMNFWRPPTQWTDVTNSDFYGTYVRSAYYIKGGDGSQLARWHVPVKKSGYYDLYYYFYQARRGGPPGRGRNKESGKYHFVIHSDEGADEVELENSKAENGWNHLGTFYFSTDTALVELSNKYEGRIVFADAVKIVEM